MSKELSNEDSISLNKYISSSGLCSRREADQLIKLGKVKINGKETTKGNRVLPDDVVTVNGKQVTPPKGNVYIVYNKPKGIVCTSDPKEPKNIISAINYPERLIHIGRLDKQSQGLILLSSDGNIVNKILRAGNQHEKEYIVTVDKEIDKQFISKMSKGIPILGTVTKKCKVELLNEYTFSIILTQGLNRQIRRMCEYLGYEVSRLERIRIMNIEIGNLNQGGWRKLTPKEVSEILELVADSTKTEEASYDKNRKKKWSRPRPKK